MVERSADAQTSQGGASRLGDRIREVAHSLLYEKKERLATAADGFADAFRHAAEALDPNGRYGGARYAEQAAAGIARLSASVRNCHLDDMVASAEGLARRRPALYVAGAVAAGFILARLLSQPAPGGSPRTVGPARERW